MHHATADYSDGGNTNVDELALACGYDNRLVEKDSGYTTSVNERGEVEWHPPPDLDNGQQRINYYHRPELLLPEEPEQQPDWDDEFDEAAVNADLLWIAEITEVWQTMGTDHCHGGTGVRGP